MKESYVIASDLGTGGCKTVVIDDQGVVIASANCEYPTHYPHPGWCEQNPQDWLFATCKTVKDCLSKIESSESNIVGYGLVGVTHNAVLLDDRDRILRPSILTYDTRSQKESDELNRRWGKSYIFSKTCNTVSPLWSWPQFYWLKHHEPDVWKSVNKIFFQKDYVRHCLAPSHFSDHIEVEGSLLYDPFMNEWIEEFTQELELSKTALPNVTNPTQVVSKISAHGESLTGLPKGTPVITGTTDTAAELFGAGAAIPGQGMVKLASVGRIACVSEVPSSIEELLNYRHIIDGLWYPGTASKHATSAFRWLKDILWQGSDYQDMDNAANDVKQGSEGLIFHPHLQGEWAPHWDNNLRASFIGATMRHTKSHFTRAVMEGVGFSLRAGVDYMEASGLPFEEIRLVGQGASSRLWQKILANILNRKIVLPHERDAAYGAALTVGMGVGLLENKPKEIAQMIRIDDSIEPNPNHSEYYDELYEIYKLSDEALKQTYHKLTEFEKKYSGEIVGG